MPKVLVVDDRPLNRHFLATLLGSTGYEVAEASDGAEALPMMHNFGPDVAIVDILMPTMDGYEFVQQARKDPAIANVPVIFWSATYGEREARLLARASGVQFMLTKPAEPEVILRTVEAALAGRQAPAATELSSSEESTERLEEAARLSLRLAALVEFQMELASERDPLRALQTFARGARGIISAKFCLVHIFDESGRTTGFETAGLEATAAQAYQHSQALNTLVKSMSSLGRPVRLEKASGDRFALLLQQQFPEFCSYLGVPIASATRSYGWCGFINKVGFDSFTDEDQRVATTIAAQMGLAYENLLLYEDALRKANELAEENRRVLETTAALRDREAKLRRIFDSGLLGIAYWNRGAVTDANDAVLKMYGYTRAELEAGLFHWAELTPPEHRALDEAALAQIAATGICEPYQKENIRKDGTRIDVLMGAAAFEGHTDRGVSFVLDISAQKEAERALVMARDELEQKVVERTAELVEANRELEAFTYTVSHDLRAPLRGMSGFSSLLLNEYSEQIDPRGRDYLGRIHAASQRMSQLIDDLLRLSRLNRAEVVRRPVDLSELARSAAADLQRSEPDRIVSFEIQTGILAEGDPRLLRVVLENLLGNAWKFTGKQPSARIEFGATLDGTATYFVRDNGAGFDMAYAGKLFGVFQRLHTQKEFEGTGVGLASVQRIIRRHGGKVWGEGSPGGGAIFYFTLG